MKEKIAISLTDETLRDVDALVDGSEIRSRSQAIELLIRKGMGEMGVKEAVLILSEKHKNTPFRKFKSSTLLEEQKKFFRGSGIETTIIVSQEKTDTDIANNIVTSEKKNGDALRHAKGKISSDFVVMSGDTYNYFNLKEMIEKHLKNGKIATIGLMSAGHPGKYGTAILEGDLVTDFTEKPKRPESHIVNAGIYIFSPRIFQFMKGSIEKDVLPLLAKKKELVGYFTMGEYRHFE